MLCAGLAVSYVVRCGVYMLVCVQLIVTVLHVGLAVSYVVCVSVRVTDVLCAGLAVSLCGVCVCVCL